MPCGFKTSPIMSLSVISASEQRPYRLSHVRLRALLFRLASDDDEMFLRTEPFKQFVVVFADLFLLVRRLVALRLAAAGNPAHALLGREIEKNGEIGTQELHGGGVELNDPLQGNKPAVVSKRGEVKPIAQYRDALLQMFDDAIDAVRDMIEPVRSEERRDRALVRIDAPRKTGAKQRPEWGIGWLVREDATDPPALQELARHLHLRGLSAAVRALEYDKFSSVRHNICIIPFQREFVNPRTDAALLAPRKSASFYVVLRIERRPPRGFRAAGAVSNVRFKFNYAHRRRR